jgi:hypothetical protein
LEESEDSEEESHDSVELLPGLITVSGGKSIPSRTSSRNGIEGLKPVDKSQKGEVFLDEIQK